MEQLPEVVTRTLVPFLETATKLALRLTCTSTAEWVTTKEFLQQFKIPIQTDADLLIWINKKPFLSSEDDFRGWSNFFMQHELSQYNPLTLSQFFTTFHSYLETLELSHCFGFHGAGSGSQLFQILSKLQNLKHLTIHDLSISISDDEVPLDVGGNLDKEKINLGLHKLHLDTFSIKQLSFSRPADLRAWIGIYKLLAIQTANFVTIPKPHYQGDDDVGVTWAQVKTLQWVLITEPMLASMESRSTIFVRKGRKIILDVKQLVPIHFGRLAERCMTMNREGFNLYFTNVHANHVKYVFLLSGDEGSEDFLGMILSISEKIDDRRPLRLWTGLEKMCIRSSRCDVRKYYDHFGDATEVIFPTLKKMEIEFDSVLKEDPGFLSLHRLISLLFKVKRVNVREVILKWTHHSHASPKNVIDLYEIRENFCNLQKFVVISEGISEKLV